MKALMTLIFCVGLLAFMQCTPSRKEEQQTLKDAAMVHNVMVQQAEALEEKLNDQLNPTINSDSVEAWKAELEQWEADLVEVPGNESHVHKEGEHHHHDHQALNVTAAQMMIIQLELKRRLEILERRVEHSLE